MDQPFFTNLPSEIIIDILSRLPIKAIISCKCVCKSLSELLETPEFVNSRLLKSVPGLLVNLDVCTPISLQKFEFVDDLELEHHELYNNLITKVHRRAFIGLDFATYMYMEGSANGLLFLLELKIYSNPLYVCNPITREYIKLPDPNPYQYPSMVTYEFGVSKTSNKYKVVRIFQECVRDPTGISLVSITKSECKVYTLGTGSWRSIDPGVSYEYNCHSSGTLFNGNLHWLVVDLMGSILISYFDLETEVFDTILPPLLGRIPFFLGNVAVLDDCLCLCDNTSDYEIVIWVMKKCWTKEFTISKVPNFAGQFWKIVYPLKVFRNGDVLMSWEKSYLFYYTKQTKSLRRIGNSYFEARLHVSGFLSLKAMFDSRISMSKMISKMQMNNKRSSMLRH